MVQSTTSPHWQYLRDKTDEILSVRAEITRLQTRTGSVVEAFGRVLAYPAFFVLLLSAHLIWVLLNLPIWPWFAPWDPYPFMFLATFTSAEAPFFALLVLMYQRRNSRISELREELEIQTSLHLEREVTVLLRMLREVHAHLGIETREEPKLLERLEQGLDPVRLMQHLRADLAREEHDKTIAP